MSKINSSISFLTITALAVSLLGMPFIPVNAAALQNKSDSASSLKISTVADHTIAFRTATGVSATGNTITLTFPAGFNMGTVAFGDIDLAVSAGGQSTCGTSTVYATEKTLAAAPGAGVWGAAVAGQVLTLTAPTNSAVGEIATNACAQIQIGTNATTGAAGANQITNPTAGNYTIALGGTFGDSGNILVNIISNDQIAVTATVAETLSFSISSNAIDFGNLDSTAARYAATSTAGSASEVEAHNIVVATNAANGYTLTLNGNTLTSGLNTINEAGCTASSSVTGAEQFGLRMTATGGTGTVQSPYAAAGFGFCAASFPQSVATALTATAATTYSVRYLANIAATTEAAQYSSTLTYLATANF